MCHLQIGALIDICILGIVVDLSSRRGRFHISEREELMILCLSSCLCTLCNAYESVLPNNQFAFFLILHALVSLIHGFLRVEGRELQKSLMQLTFFVDDAVHWQLFQIVSTQYYQWLMFDSKVRKHNQNDKYAKRSLINIFRGELGNLIIFCKGQNYSIWATTYLYHRAMIFHIVLTIQTIIISIKYSQMLNKKLSDLFLRKESKKEEQKQVLFFDQNSFTCKLVSNGTNTDLIRVQTQLKDTGLPLDEIKCKWYIKNSHDFKQIEDVTSTYYQPCLDDVGSIICVQIEPFLEGKKYNGITIMEQTQIIEIDNQLQTQLDQFLSQNRIKMDARIEAIYSQNSKFQDLELPLEVKAEINKGTITFFKGEDILQKITISQQYPNIEFIRKTFSSLLFNYNDKESMKLSLHNNSYRDLFTLIVRTCAAHSNPEPEAVNPEKAKQEDTKYHEHDIKEIEPEEKIQIVEGRPLESLAVKSTSISPVVSSTESLEETSKSSKDIKAQKDKGTKEESKQNSTLFVLKLDELNKQLKALRRKYELLQQNYHIEKQGKCQAQNQLENLKKQNEATKKQRDEALAIVRKVKQLKEDNCFYKNEILIIKKDWKEQKEKRIALERSINQMNCQKSLEVEEKLANMKLQFEQWQTLKKGSDRRCEELESQIQKYKEALEKSQNENHMLKRKLQSLASEKGLQKVVPAKNNPTGPEKEAESRIKQLQMKLKNLQMLLKYKTSHGQQGNSGFQLLVNKLTETITQKEIEMNELKKINKNLLEQLRQAKQKIK